MLNDTQIKFVTQKYGTPLYIFDVKELTSRILEIKKLLGENVELCYAMKANPFLVTYLDGYVDKFEVCSFGEYEICKKQGLNSKKIVYSGVYKQRKELCETIQDDFQGCYTIESKRQFQQLQELTSERKRNVKILIRLTSGNQFGLEEEEIVEILNAVKTMSWIEFEGIHFFSGTQKKNMEVVEQELAELDGVCDRICQKTGIEAKQIEYGAGLFVDYFGNQEWNYNDVEKLGRWLRKRKRYKFTVELGRYVVAACGMYLTSIVDRKQNHGKNYCMVDGGIHQVNYYGQMLGLKVPPVRHILQNGRPDENHVKCTVCGALCTSRDVLLRDFEMRSPEVGDILAFQAVGAYSITEASALFLSRELPYVLAFDENQQTEVLRERMSVAYLNSGSGKRELKK